MEVPTQVKLADGTMYDIATGPWGSWVWVIQANRISVAYRQVGDQGNADRWAREYDRRHAIYDAIQDGQQVASVLAQFGADLVTAPVKILADIGNAAIDVGQSAGGVVTTAAQGAASTVKWLPVIVLGGLAVVALGFSKGALRIGR